MNLDHGLNIVLVEPEIPGNTGTIGRLCVGLEATLTLVEPLGFSLEDRYLKRAGLDYWPHLRWRVLPTLERVLEDLTPSRRSFFLTTKTSKPYSSVRFQRGDFLIFGRETKGLPAAVLEKYADRALTIPMYGKTRSINLAVAVGVVAYEAMRQITGGFVS